MNADTPLRCDFNVTNIGDETKNLYLYGNRSKAVDSAGNELFGIQGSLGGQEYSQSVNSDLINSIPIKGSVIFEKEPEGEVQAIVINCYGTEYFNVTFTTR